MSRHTSLATAIVLTLSTGLAQAGPGCMHGNHPGGMQAYPGTMPPGYMGGYNTMRAPMSYAPHRGGGYMAAPAAPQPGYGKSVLPEKTAATRVSAADAEADTVTVRIRGMQFEPATVSIQPGTTGTWIQEDRAPHTVSGENGELSSNTILSGQTFSHTFTSTGEYNYSCNFHPMMKGAVVVEGPPA